MAQVTVEGEIGAGIDEVWKLVSDFVGFIASQGLEVKGEGEGIGMLRTLTIGDIIIVERLEELNDASHKTSYSIVSGPIPVTNYLGTIQLTAAGDATTAITWTGTYQPDGVTEEQAARMMERTYQGGIKAIQKHFGG